MSLSLSRSEHNTYRPFVVMAIVAALLTVWQHMAWHQQCLSLPEYAAAAITTPLQVGISAFFTKVHDLGLAVAAAPRLVEENRRLKKERDELKALRIQTIDAIVENKAIREKLGFSLNEPFEGIPAQVISRSSSRVDRWVRIRAGGGRQLQVGDVVREASGLVGRVVQANGSTARVVLAVDAHHAIRGKDLRTGEEGMVYACAELEAGVNRLKMEKMRRGARIMHDDIIVTSELGGTYPGGIPIGTVEAIRGSESNVNNLTAYIKPFVDFDRLDYVYVVRPELPRTPTPGE